MDLNKDGVISIEEAQASIELKKIQITQQKQEHQRILAYISVALLVLVTGLLLVPGAVPLEQISAVSEFVGMFYLSLATIISAYFGFSSFLAAKNKPK